MGVYMPVNNDKKQVMALMFVVIGIVLLMVSFVLPWWGFHTEVEIRDSDGDIRTIQEGGFGLSISSGISNARSGTSFYIGDFSTPTVYGITAMFLILSILFASLLGVNILINLLGIQRMPKLPMILGILALIFCLLAPLIFMAGLPMAMKADEEKEAKAENDEYFEPDHDDPTKSFFGSYEDNDDGMITRSNWGGDIGWVMSFIAFVMLIISVIFVRPARVVQTASLVSPELSYSPEPEPRPLHRTRYDHDSRHRSSRRPPPPPEDFEDDYRMTRRRRPPSY